MENDRKVKYSSFAWTIICITLITGIVEIVLTEDFQIDQYLGCFYDRETQRGAQSGLSDANLTIDMCIQHCRNRPTSSSTDLWSYAILKNGTDCRCSKNYGGSQVSDSFCNGTCGGNVSHNCGGTYENGNSTYVLFAVCPIGTHGSMCGDACHCKSQIPCDRQTGSCPDGCHGNYTGAQCNQLTSFSDQYIGCYRDNNSDRAMEKGYEDYSNNHLQRCLDFCFSKYSYAGPQFGAECWCGESYDKHGRIDEGFCNSTCSGNRRQICGGGVAISVYGKCPTGYYGPNCAKTCNCEGRCHFKNGTCLNTGCKPGWTGNTCNIRDCKNSNGSCESYEACIVVEPIAASTMSVCRCQSGYWRMKAWGNCTDINECLEIPNICGSSAISCNNTEGGYTCHCMNGNVVQNSVCVPDKSDTSEQASNVGIVVGAIVGSLCLLIAVLVVVGILYSRKSRLPCFGNSSGNENQRQNSAAPAVGLAKGTSSESEAHLYDCIASVYDVSSPVRTAGTEELSGFVLTKLSTSGLLEKEFKSVPQETKEPCNVGRHRNMKVKNRFKNIIPYDHNRVVLERKGSDVLSDYINASHVTSYSSSEKVIATQGPKPETVNDFWRMVVEQDASVIVMITNLMENRKAKCAKYWPEAGCSATFGEVSVKSQSEDHWNDHTARKLLVTSNKKSLSVVQWHFLPWPDHGVPSDSNSFLNFHRRIRNSMTPGKSMVVHCSAGAGRTGCFFAIDYLLQQGKTDGRVDILECLQRLRQMRCQMVQTLEQYQFIHRTLLFSFTVGETAIPNSKFASTLNELQRINNTSKGFSPLDAQYQILTDPNQDMAGICYSRASTKAVNKNRVAMLDPAFTWGWKVRDAYLSLICPTSETVQDFYALCNEYKCKAVILIDAEKVLDGSVFPSSQEIKLQGQIISCVSSSREDYGTSYKMTERRGTDDTYANVGEVNVYANTEGGQDKRELNVLHVSESITDDSIGFRSLFSLSITLRMLNNDGSNRPTVVISKRGFGLSAFCLAALNAFQMSADENEVDVFQIVQEIRKSRQQFDISLPAFKELHSVVGQFIETSRGSYSDFC